MDEPFDTGYGGPQAPGIVAADGERIYFVSQYDGATGIEVIEKDLTLYLDFKSHPVPYPGG